MSFDQTGSLIFRVARGAAGQWVVTEDGFEKPLAAFDEQADAIVYADDMAKAKAGSKVKVSDEAGHHFFAHRHTDKSH